MDNSYPIQFVLKFEASHELNSAGTISFCVTTNMNMNHTILHRWFNHRKTKAAFFFSSDESSSPTSNIWNKRLTCSISDASSSPSKMGP